MDEDWHVRPGYCKYVELHKAVTCQKSGENKKAKSLGLEAKDMRRGFYDLGSVQKQVRLDLWAGPTAALVDALERAEQNSGLVQSSATSDV